jgi:hypothetical protein
MVDLRMGPIFTHIRPPYDHRKNFSIIFFFLVFHVDFEKRNHFEEFPHPKMVICGTTLKRKKIFFKIILSKKIKKNTKR